MGIAFSLSLPAGASAGTEPILGTAAPTHSAPTASEHEQFPLQQSFLARSDSNGAYDIDERTASPEPVTQSEYNPIPLQVQHTLVLGKTGMLLELQISPEPKHLVSFELRF